VVGPDDELERTLPELAVTVCFPETIVPFNHHAPTLCLRKGWAIQPAIEE